MPAFQGSAERAHASRQWAIDNRPRFMGDAGAAIMTAIQQHAEEQKARKAPEATESPAG